MTDPTIVEILDAFASQLQTTLGTAVPGIQIVGRMERNPTPPCVDIYPGDPFQEQTGFELGSREMNFTVRARVTTADHKGGQELLYSLMDARAATSLAMAIVSDQTVGGKAQQIAVVDGPSAFGEYADSGGEGSLLGCQWTARVVI